MRLPYVTVHASERYCERAGVDSMDWRVVLEAVERGRDIDPDFLWALLQRTRSPPKDERYVVDADSFGVFVIKKHYDWRGRLEKETVITFIGLSDSQRALLERS